MNDRINHLWEEAKVMLVEWRLSPKMAKKIPSIMEEDYFIREKFAELIVRECMDICEQQRLKILNNPDDPSWTEHLAECQINMDATFLRS